MDTGLLHLVQRGGAWGGCGPAQSPPRYTKCNAATANPSTAGVPTSLLFDVALTLPLHPSIPSSLFQIQIHSLKLAKQKEETQKNIQKFTVQQKLQTLTYHNVGRTKHKTQWCQHSVRRARCKCKSVSKGTQSFIRGFVHQLTWSEQLTASDFIRIFVVVVVVSGTDVERLLLADHTTVVETNAAGPRHLWVDDGPLQPASSVGEPVRHLHTSTSSSAVADRPRDAPCRWKFC